jgi:gliding motility-associated-like protein
MATDTLEVIESTDGPQLHLGPDIHACAGDTITIAAGISGVDYLWHDGSTESFITATASGNVILTVSNNCGSDVDSIHVSLDLLPPVSALGEDLDLCDGMTAQLTATHEAGTAFSWSTGESEKIIVIEEPGLYWLEKTNSCGSHRDTIEVIATFPPEPFYLGPDTVICPGTSVLLIAPVHTGTATWQDGSHGIQFEASEPILYSLEIENACGKAYDDMWVAISADAPALSFDDKIFICYNDTLELDASQSFPVTYAWSTGETSPVIEVTVPGRYGVKLDHACFTLEKDIDVVLDADCAFPSTFYIPTVFSPNGDGINDLFQLHTNSVTTILSITGGIYDRWGNMVYQPSGDQLEWDGTAADRKVMPGVYAYNIIIFYLEGSTKKAAIRQGDITVVR